MWDFSSRNRQAIEPVRKSNALTLGSLVHEVLADWMTLYTSGVTDVALADMTANRGYAMLDQVRADYEERIGANMSPSEYQELFDVIILAQEMVANYEAHWHTPLPANFRLIQPEQTCLIRIPDVPDDGWLEATLDALVADDATGLVYFLERKTYGQRPRLEKLELEDQFTAYGWVVQQLGFNLGGMLYDGLWKRSLEKKRGPDRELDELFIRHLFAKSQPEIDEFEQHLRAEYVDMLNPTIYTNRRWEGCYDCDFEQLCKAVTLDEDVEYVKDTYYKPRTTNEAMRFAETE